MGVVALAIAGCGASPSKVDVATVLAPQLASVGISADPGSLTCDSPATLAAGGSVSCTYTTNGQPVGLVVDVSSVDGTKLGFSVTTQPKEISATALASSVATRVSAQLGATVSSATCEGKLVPEVGQATTCTLKNGAETKTVKIAVTKVVGGQVNYTITPS